HRLQGRESSDRASSCTRSTSSTTNRARIKPRRDDEPRFLPFPGHLTGGRAGCKRFEPGESRRIFRPSPRSHVSLCSAQMNGIHEVAATRHASPRERASYFELRFGAVAKMASSSSAMFGGVVRAPRSVETSPDLRSEDSTRLV